MPLYREAVDSDLHTICVLGEEVNALHHSAHPTIFAGAPVDPIRDAAHWASSINKPSSTTFVAEEADRIVGFLSVRIDNESHTLLQPLCVASVGTVGVSAQFRGQGIGKSLMRSAEEWAVARGASEVRLIVWSFNQPALELYRELGYAPQYHRYSKRLQTEA